MTPKRYVNRPTYDALHAPLSRAEAPFVDRFYSALEHELYGTSRLDYRPWIIACCDDYLDFEPRGAYLRKKRPQNKKRLN